MLSISFEYYQPVWYNRMLWRRPAAVVNISHSFISFLRNQYQMKGIMSRRVANGRLKIIIYQGGTFLCLKGCHYQWTYLNRKSFIKSHFLCRATFKSANFRRYVTRSTNPDHNKLIKLRSRSPYQIVATVDHR